MANPAAAASAARAQRAGWRRGNGPPTSAAPSRATAVQSAPSAKLDTPQARPAAETAPPRRPPALSTAYANASVRPDAIAPTAARWNSSASSAPAGATPATITTICPPNVRYAPGTPPTSGRLPRMNATSRRSAAPAAASRTPTAGPEDGAGEWRPGRSSAPPAPAVSHTPSASR
jgi:hypothetical protein